MKWTIGMPCYNNYTEVWFTVQSLRMHHDMKDKEILLIDNYGDEALSKWVKNNGKDVVRYIRDTEIQGVSHAKNRVFAEAKGEFVLCMDSHILMKTGALDVELEGDNFYQGPLMYSSCAKYSTAWLNQWRKNMWGIWSPAVTELPEKPFEIWVWVPDFSLAGHLHGSVLILASEDLVVNLDISRRNIGKLAEKFIVIRK